MSACLSTSVLWLVPLWEVIDVEEDSLLQLLRFADVYHPTQQQTLSFSLLAFPCWRHNRIPSCGPLLIQGKTSAETPILPLLQDP